MSSNGRAAAGVAVRGLRAAIAGIALVGMAAGPVGAQPVQRFGLRIPMRDGVRLDAHLWLPDTTGRHPTILIRTPYLKAPQYARYRLAGYVRRGYAVMLQDTRGRGDSDGEFDFYFPEAKDGYDTIEWIARQSWSNGRVGMDGGSYLGTVQWLAARERPPHLACIAPTASSGRLFDEIPYQGGAFRLGWALNWLNLTAGRSSQGELAELVKWDDVLRLRPLVRHDTAYGRPLRLYQEFLAHSTLDDYWKRIHFTAEDFRAIDIPVLTVTGWFDGDQLGALYYWDGIEAHRARKDDSFLIIGPWNHGQTYLGGALSIGELELGPEAVLDIQGNRLAFFDWCLRQSSDKFDVPRVRVFLTGSNRWRSFDRYPPASRMRSLFLHSGGAANTLDGDGRLSWTEPGEETPDRFTYNPMRPVPAKSPTEDHRSVERRDDVLVYTGEALTEPFDLLGRVFVALHAATDGVDTDFTAKLLDVYPDGRAVLLGPASAGIRRARYRHGYERPELLTPNRVEEYSIELFDIGHTFLPGHRIRLEISSSAVPMVDPNTNTGRPFATDTTWRVARQTVFHDGRRSSRVILPVAPAER